MPQQSCLAHRDASAMSAAMDRDSVTAITLQTATAIRTAARRRTPASNPKGSGTVTKLVLVCRGPSNVGCEGKTSLVCICLEPSQKARARRERAWNSGCRRRRRGRTRKPLRRERSPDADTERRGYPEYKRGFSSEKFLAVSRLLDTGDQAPDLIYWTGSDSIRHQEVYADGGSVHIQRRGRREVLLMIGCLLEYSVDSASCEPQPSLAEQEVALPSGFLGFRDPRPWPFKSLPSRPNWTMTSLSSCYAGGTRSIK